MPRAKTVKAPNYTPEQVIKMVADYQAGVSVDAIALELNKSKRSVIGKLVREKVYVPADPAEKPVKVEGPTKKDLLAKLESHGFVTKGFEPASKDALAALVSHLEKAA